MIGIVIVSHSAKLAQGVEELARGMSGPEVKIKIAGGLNLPDQPLGTDPLLILAAIEEAYSEDGVVVLMDMGSALLSAEMALEMLPPAHLARVKLIEAPLVEGAVSAAVQARLGNSLEQVIAECRGVMEAKAAHLGLSVPLPVATETRPEVSATAPALELRLTIPNPLGLHARPAARFVQTVGHFSHTEVQITNLTTGRGPVNAKSINGVTTLGVRQNHAILVTASGPDAQAVLAALQVLANDYFGDDPTSAAPIVAPRKPATAPLNAEAAHVPGKYQALPVSPGIALGPAYVVRREQLHIPETLIDDPQAEWKGFIQALEKTKITIQADRQAAALRTNVQTAEIFDAHLLFLTDQALLVPTQTAIFDQRRNAAAAWDSAVKAMAETYRTLDDAYLQARAADVEAVGRQVLLNLLGARSVALQLTEACILIADDLTPADTAHLDPAQVLGICTALGGPTSHSAILARALGIPAVAGLGGEIMKTAPGTLIAIDGTTGKVLANPAAEVVKEFQQRAAAEKAAEKEARAASSQPAITRDQHRVEVVANIGSAKDAAAAVKTGAEGVGLFRTEFLFLDRQTAPDEEEQYQAYLAAAKNLAGRPMIIRTLDAGGDKQLPYLDQGVEANPFLGWRAVRLCLAQPELFKTQLRAIVRVAAVSPVKVMFPMVATLEEWRAAARLLAEAQTEVRARGLAVPTRLETGIMIEIPSAALRAAHFAAEVDFFSIGTNDLTQYTLAAERGNPRVASLADAYHPAVLELIQRVVEAAHAKGKWVGVCGELAGEALAVPLLVGLGVDELSMSAPAIPRVKQAIRALDFKSLQARVAKVLALETAQAVRAAAAELTA
jgi:multiphosphoryl transfer protein